MRTDTSGKYRLFIAFILFTVLAMAVSPVISDDSDASKTISCEGLTISTYDDIGEISVGDAKTIKITLSNDGSSNNISVKVTCDSGNTPFTMSADATDFTIKPNDYKQITVTAQSDKFADHGDYSLLINFKVYNHQSETSGTADLPISVTVVSKYVSDGYFNKIMGKFDNNLPYPFNTPTASAIITELIWVVIALAAYAAIHFAAGRYFRDEKEECREVRIRVGGLVILVLITYGLSESALVYGANEFVIRSIRDVSDIIYTLIGAYIVWDLYKNIVTHILRASDRKHNDRMSGSLAPLFHMLGQLIIGTVTTAIILSLLGFDLIGMLAGAGIIGVAVSLGAQNTLSQFFSGISLLATRPFREGDYVRIGNDEKVYKVIKVKLMNTEFKDWASSEHLILSNSTVASSTIYNMTKGSHAYQMYIYYDVGYDSDLDLVKDIIVDTANNHPQVITDGSFDKPGARIMSFDDTTISARLSVYIYDFKDSVLVRDELLELGYKNLEDNGIDVPYERIDVHVYEG